MTADQVRAMLAAALPACEIQVQGDDGRHFEVVVVGECFAGVRPVKRQQMVYAPLTGSIASGELHAVAIRALTPAEREAR